MYGVMCILCACMQQLEEENHKLSNDLGLVNIRLTSITEILALHENEMTKVCVLCVCVCVVHACVCFVCVFCVCSTWDGH